MLDKKFIIAVFFILTFFVTNAFYFNLQIPFKPLGGLDVSLAFGTTRISEIDDEESDSSISNSSTGSDADITRETDDEESDSSISNSSTGSDADITRETDDEESDSSISNSSTGSDAETNSPIADAGTDIAVQSNVLTQLDGSKSYNPNNYDDNVSPSLTFDWTQTGGPAVILNNPTSTNPTFTSPPVEEATRLTFQLVVSIDTTTSDPDSVTVSVTPNTPPEPVTPNTPPEPVTPNTPPEPVTPNTPPEPVTPNTPPEPVTPNTPPEPVTPNTPPEPVTPNTPPEPVTPNTPPEPVTPNTPPEPVTPNTPPEPVTPNTQEFQTVVRNCETNPTSTFTGGSLTIITDQDFSQVYKITPNPYTYEDSLYFVNNDFFDCDSNNSLISLTELDYSWYTVEILDQENADNYKTFDISINENFSFPIIYLFDRAFAPNLVYEPIRSQFIIWLNESVTTNAELVSQDYVLNGEIKFLFENPPGFVINTNNSGQLSERDLLSKVSKDPRIFAINQDLNGKIASVKYNNQTVPDSLERINANVLNMTSEILQGSSFSPSTELDFSNVDIAILDTGVSLDHPDLNVYKNVSFIAGALTGDDDLGHGSHIAGIAAAKDNSIGILGVAPGAKLWAVKVCDVNGNCPLSSQIKGLQYVNEHADEIDIVNLSIENPPSDKLDKTITESLSKGLIYVVAAGNSNINTSLTSPARIPGVIAVSAISDSDGECGGRGNGTIGGPDDYAATFSNYGNSIDFAAPGVNVFSTYRDEGYAFDSGTSMAAPVVAGQAAVYKSFKPNATSEEVISALLNSSIPYTTPCAGLNHGHFQDAKNYHKEPLIFSLSIPEVGVIPTHSQ